MSIRKLSFEEVLAGRPSVEELANSPPHPIAVILDNIRSLHNVGSIFRTSDAARITKIYLCGITGKPPRDEIRKTSLGSEESVDWAYHNDARDAILECKSLGYQIVGLEHTNQSVDFRSAPYRFPVCLVVGHEYNGIQQHLVERCDMAVEIPMYGIKQSLNVSVAYGIAVYTLLQRWEQSR